MRFASGAKFAILSFLCVMALAASMGFAISSLLTRSVEDWEWENTAALARREVERTGVDALLTAPRGVVAREASQREFARLLQGLPEVVRVKVWDRHATVLWSNEPRLIGQRFPDNDELNAALAGDVSVEMKTLAARENAYERGSFSVLAEVYVPIFSKTTGQVIGVIEVYKSPLRLLATIQRGRLVVWSISLAGALVLYLVLFPLVRQVYGRHVREEALRAHTARLEAQRAALFQAEKVAAMGQLLAGVAHELNNPLSAIVGYTQLMLMRIDSGPMAEQLDRVAQSAERCTRIVKNFLSLARRHLPQRQRVRLNALVEEAVELLAYPFRIDNVEVTCRLGKDLPQMWADPHQLQQVLVNLLTNAHHAMRAAAQPRRIVLTTRYETATDRVVLTVADSGPGVPTDLQARIFEPFFTTKSPGQGTGLGLSLCRGIVEGHGGALRLETTPGGGATFVAELPIGVAPTALEEAPVVEPMRPTVRKTILVVDDEPDVATLLAEALALDGHQVDTVHNGSDALERLRGRGYHLIFSDMKMPGMSGAEFYRTVAQNLPGVERRMIFVTGDSMNVTTRRFLEETGAASLGKPFGIDEIRRLVHAHPASIGEDAPDAPGTARS